MKPAVKLTIPGKPVAQGRPRFSRRGKYVSTYDPPKSRGYKEYIKQIARQELHIEPMTGSIMINGKYTGTFKKPVASLLSGKNRTASLGQPLNRIQTTITKRCLMR